MENDEKSIGTFTDELVGKLKIRKKRIPKHAFKEGNKAGKKFGSGQPTNLGGRKPSATTLFNEMKSGWEDMGYAARDIANTIVRLGLDETIEPRFRFPFLKEAAMRIFGPVDYAVDEALKHLKERQSTVTEKPFELSLPLLEAAAVGDIVKVVKELKKQGKLEEVVKQVEGEE
jgi:hypothetical protein